MSSNLTTNYRLLYENMERINISFQQKAHLEILFEEVEIKKKWELGKINKRERVVLKIWIGCVVCMCVGVSYSCLLVLSSSVVRERSKII